MAGAELRDRLQPALLDRLVDEAPDKQKEADTQRLMSKQHMRNAVLRDLSWLFNATQVKERIVEAYPALADSVLNYGLPALSGQQASKVDIGALERTIRQAICDSSRASCPSRSRSRPSRLTTCSTRTT
jgi:type VI secretion system protein ImpF